jgi:lipoyl(octanoyl) transferase
MILEIEQLGRVEYRRAWEYQKTLHNLRLNEEIADTLLLLEHPPVITLGKRGRDEDLLLSEEERIRQNVEVVRIGRGGQTTYHGPGQLVGYIIINLYNHDRKIKRFVGGLEHIIMKALSEGFGITSSTDPAHPGVWVGNEKIAAVGISVNRHVTMHGFALNVATELEHFNWIVPCGIRDRGVTSISRITGRKESLEGVQDLIAEGFSTEYGYRPRIVPPFSRETAAVEKERRQ